MTSNAHVIASSSQLSHSSSGSNNIIGGHFKVLHKIGEGSFGVVFAGPYSSIHPTPSIHLQLSLFLLLISNYYSQISRGGLEASESSSRCHQIRTQPSSLTQFKSKHLPDPLSSLFHVPQEPRKSDAPQLRDEYRSYRTLRGLSELLPFSDPTPFPLLSF